MQQVLRSVPIQKMESKKDKYATQLDLLKITTTNHDSQVPNLLVIQSDTISDKNV